MSSIASGSGLFIAPEGAMQFEVQRGWMGREFAESERFALWVMPEVPRRCIPKNPDCPHMMGFPVLIDSVPPQYLKSNQTGVQRIVCACVGRIIE